MKIDFKTITLLIFLALGLLLISPLIDAVVLALLGSFILHPIRKRLDKYTKNRFKSTAIIVGVLLLFLLTFLIYSSYFLFTFLNSFYSESLSLEDKLSETLNKYGLSGIGPALSGFVLNSVNNMVITQETAKWFLISLLKLAVGLYILFFLLAEQEKVKSSVSEFVDYLTPKNVKKNVKSFLVILEEVYRSFFIRYILAAIIVGALAYLGFFLTNTPFALLLAMLCALGALLPILTTYLIYIPASIWHIYVGHIWQGVFLFFYGGIFLSILPTFYIIPMLTSKGSDIHPALVLISLIAGPMLFGPMGLIYGPFIAGIVQTIYNYYLKEKVRE